MPADENQQPAAEEESGIEIHTLETDMKALGIDTGEPESEPEATPDTKQDDASLEEVESKEQKESKKKTRAQRRIEKQQRENKALKEEKEKLEAELARLKDKPATNDEEEISLDDYDSYDEYEKAVKAQKASLEEKPKEEVKSDPQESTTIKIDQLALSEMFEDGNETYKDFEAKVRDDKLVLPPEVLNEVLISESPSDLIYRIASDHKKALELAAIDDPHDLTVAIAKLEAELEKKEKTPEVPTKTNAPKPITPVTGSSVKGLSLDDDDLTYEQHKALLAKAQTYERGGFI